VSSPHEHQWVSTTFHHGRECSQCHLSYWDWSQARLRTRAAEDAVLGAARAAVRCIALEWPHVPLAGHTRPEGCLRALSDAVAALDQEG
jgi:hypothetical protein